MSDNSLRECPFCGSFSVEERDFESFIGYTLYYIACKNCGATSGSRPFQEAAINAWNTRKTALTNRDIQAWYYVKHGALLANKPVPGLGKEAMDPKTVEFYGGKYLIAESLSLEMAINICQALGLRFCGHIKTYKDQERWTALLLENKS